MRKYLILIMSIIALSASPVSAAGTGQECKTGTNVSPQDFCTGGTICLQAIGKKYCSNPGMICGWGGTGGFPIGATKQYNGKTYVCTATGFKLSAGEKCTSGSSCGSGLCLQALEDKYCGNAGMVCGWPNTGGYALGAKKTYNGKEYACFADGFSEAPQPPQIRQLNSAEKNLVVQVFGKTINFSQVRITDTVGGDGRPWTTNSPPLYTMNVGDAYPNLALDFKALLIHEMAHVWQGQHGVPFMSNSAYHQTLSVIQNGGDAGGAYNYVGGKQWSKYNVEQQASIVEDWYMSGMSKTSKLYPYIRDNVRTGRPNATTRFK